MREMIEEIYSQVIFINKHININIQYLIIRKGISQKIQRVRPEPKNYYQKYLLLYSEKSSSTLNSFGLSIDFFQFTQSHLFTFSCKRSRFNRLIIITKEN